MRTGLDVDPDELPLEDDRAELEDALDREVGRHEGAGARASRTVFSSICCATIFCVSSSARDSSTASATTRSVMTTSSAVDVSNFSRMGVLFSANTVSAKSARQFSSDKTFNGGQPELCAI